MRPKLPNNVVVDACHSARGLDMELSECGYNLGSFGLVIVEEFSQLEAKHLQHMENLRNNVSNAVAFGLVGDPF